MLSINTNLSSLIAQTSLKSSTQLLNQAVERMTTGYKINHAKDNAANYSISTSMSTKLSAYDIAADNVAMGMDLVTTANDTISLMQNKASRLHALCTQARNGTYGAQSIDAINAEAGAIMAEINRLYSTAEYNGINLFTGASTTAATFAAPRASSSGFTEDIVEETPDVIVTDPAQLATAISTNSKIGIANAATLAKLAELVNAGTSCSGKTIILTEDIDLSDYDNWTPIGTVTNNFRGDFNGNGHVIKNMTIESSSDNQGLFGYTSGGEIKNVGIEGGSVKGNISTGLLVGFSGASSIINCYATGSVSGTNYVGGLVGHSASTSSSINNSYATGTVSGTNYVGGLVGVSGSSINNSYATGTVTGTGSRVGGLVGFSDSSINNSYATGTVTGTNYVGGLLGSGISYSISNSASVQTDSKTGVTVMTEEEIKAIYTPESMGFTEDNGWTIVNGQPLLSWQKEAQQGGSTPGGGAGGGANGVVSFILQIGINSDSSCQIGFDTNFSYDLSAVGVDISSDEALATINNFLNLLSDKATTLGAVQNRLESALDSISVNIENLTSSHSTIRDADIAEVSATYIQQQILQQASATLLSTANQSPSIALQLI